MAYEYRDVTQRPNQAAFLDVDSVQTERLIDRIEGLSEAVEVLVRYRPLSPDPADDLVLDVAINGQVDAIVTHNMRHLLKPATRFGIPCLTPGEFVKRLEREA